jgi:eukaryotic-like serine/threonine-protein kinase
MTTLQSGFRIGTYQILAPLGTGGMGQVYRARDVKLERQVALKVLPEKFASDAERISRFQREARVLASLNHPHIAQIYGLEESGGISCLVLELVEGDGLDRGLEHGPIPIEEALEISRQIALGLETAHERGILHRDLKPANIKLTADGSVKILDFGLAKIFETGRVPSNLSESPTLLTEATRSDVLLGTPGYMSPEQVRGKPTDERSDVWAFGCVLYELLTGKRAFSGESVADTMGAIAKADPAWSALPPETSPNIQRLLRRCLQKDPARRSITLPTRGGTHRADRRGRGPCCKCSEPSIVYSMARRSRSRADSCRRTCLDRIAFLQRSQSGSEDATRNQRAWPIQHGTGDFARWPVRRISFERAGRHPLASAAGFW